MIYSPGETFYDEVVTSVGGVATDADTTPAGTVNHNGTDDATFPLSVSRIDVGRYKAIGTVPANYQLGDTFVCTYAATLAGKACKIRHETNQILIPSSLENTTITVASPTASGGPIRIIAKDAYLSADGRELVFVKATGEPWPSDLTGRTITFTATKSANNPSTGGTQTITASGTVVIAAGVAQQVNVELTSALTTNLAIGVGTKGYDYDVVATSGSDRTTLRTGQMTVIANVTP